MPAAPYQPLANLLRPRKLADMLGQDHLTGAQGILTQSMQSFYITNTIFWGPPGCGKTTLAQLIVKESGCSVASIPATSSNVAELKQCFAQAKIRYEKGQKTIVMVDEIHRFNRAQQDVFLPVMENGTIILLGATTENPSFALNAALLSRCRVLVLHSLAQPALLQLIDKAEGYMGRSLPVTEEGKVYMTELADGDARYLLGMCEYLFTLDQEHIISLETLPELLYKNLPLYDKHQDNHYHLISALHKSLRGSDADAALYWLARMLIAGEQPLYIARRLLRFAVEDIGLADPQAYAQAHMAKENYLFLGSPEGELALAQAVIYLATAPKSNAVYQAYKHAVSDARKSGSLVPPKHILNAPNTFMKEQGFGVGYCYDHDMKSGCSGQNYFPDTWPRKQYYHPVERGFEREIKKRLEYWQKFRNTSHKE